MDPLAVELHRRHRRRNRGLRPRQRTVHLQALAKRRADDHSDVEMTTAKPGSHADRRRQPPPRPIALGGKPTRPLSRRCKHPSALPRALQPRREDRVGPVRLAPSRTSALPVRWAWPPALARPHVSEAGSRWEQRWRRRGGRFAPRGSPPCRMSRAAASRSTQPLSRPIQRVLLSWRQSGYVTRADGLTAVSPWLRASFSPVGLCVAFVTRTAYSRWLRPAVLVGRWSS